MTGHLRRSKWPKAAPYTVEVKWTTKYVRRLVKIGGKDLYIFDERLDNSAPWDSGLQWCGNCGYEFVYVARVDQPSPECPRCVASNRWRRRAVWHA